MTKWKCMICGRTFEGDTPPDSCPGIPKHQSRFKEIKDLVLTNRHGETRVFPRIHIPKDQIKTVVKEPGYLELQVETITKEPEYMEIQISKGEARNTKRK